MVFSPTALEDYAHCPRKYFYKAVMGLDEGLFAELLGAAGARRKSAGRGMTPLEKGNFAHVLLERIDFSADAAALRAWSIRVAAAAASDPDDTGVAEVIDNVVAFATSPRGRELAGWQVMREWPFILKLAGEAGYYIRGAMDLVVAETELVTVYDYKYLKKDEEELEGYRFQLRTYMLALTRAWPGRRIEGKLLFLKGGDKEAVECNAPVFEAQILRIMDAIRRRSVEEDFGLREGCDGRHCPFRQRCLTQRQI
jgi:CRISPR/Cas system-associated exonuclease Cas4 (RecB family)